MDCIVCRVSEPIEKIAEQYASVLFDAMAHPAAIIFEAFVAIWFLYQVIFKMILKGEVDWAEMLKNLCVFVLIAMILPHHSWLWNWVLMPFNEAIKELVQLITRISMGGEHVASNSMGMVAAIDGIVQQVAALGKTIMGSYNPFQILGGLVIFLVYVFVGAISAMYILEYIYTVFLISAFSPLLLIAVAFKTTRSNAIRGAQCILGSALTVFFSVVGMSLTLVVAKQLFSGITADGSLDGDLKNFAWCQNYIAVLMLGLISILQQLRAKSLASNIAGVNDGPGAAASVAGLATAAVGAGFSYSKGIGVKGAAKAFNKIKGGI